jgi:hypothetical protein
MARLNKDATEIRTALETIRTELAVIRTALPMTSLRITQAKQRTGLTGLLSPALDEIATVTQSVDQIAE